jgi:cytochrome c biogenesis protein CcmG/thiol:disulfide interchange protein DsbE
MIRFLLLLLTLPVFAAAGPVRAQANLPSHQPPTFGVALAPGDPVPALEGKTLSGSVSRFPYEDAKLTLVNFWATWCAPCRDEMPALQELQTRHADSGLRVVGALLDTASDVEALDFAGALGVRYPVLRVSLEMERAWGGVRLLPATFLVDARGRMLRKYLGADEKQLAAMRSDVETALEGKPLGPPYIPEMPDLTTIP